MCCFESSDLGMFVAGKVAYKDRVVLASVRLLFLPQVPVFKHMFDC